MGTTPFVTNVFPHVVSTIHDRITDRTIPLVSINLVNGSLSVSAQVTSSDGRTIARIEDNQWVVNPNNILTKMNSDISSMVIIDQYSKRVLNVKFMNERLIKIYILFRYGEHEIEFNENGVFIDHHPRMSNICLETPGPGVFLQIDF
jgi:hypothetical protein